MISSTAALSYLLLVVGFIGETSSFVLSPRVNPAHLTCRKDKPLDAPDIRPQEEKDFFSKDIGSENNDKRKKSSRRRRIKPTIFKHLFRHNEDISIDCWLRCAEPREFLLSCGYTEDEVDNLSQQYPRLLELDVHQILAPKIKFVVKTLGGGTGDLVWVEEEAFPKSDDEDEECDISDIDSPHLLRLSDKAKSCIPPQFFAPNLRLERHIGPRHAYLQHFGLPSGAELLAANGRRMKQFIEACSKPAQEFALLAMKWASDERAMGRSNTVFGTAVHSAERVETFEEAFQGGLVAAAKGDNSDVLALLGSSPGHMAQLLINHGSNYLEPDKHGASLLHWSCGTGNLEATRVVLDSLSQGIAYKDMEAPMAKTEIILSTQSAKDGATPLHWAACGVDKRGFGVGGHVDICRFLLENLLVGEDRVEEHANAKSWKLDTPVMFAAWGGGLEVVKLLVSYGADVHYYNDSGCNSACWAAAGGDVEVCKYLHEEHGISFLTPDKNGNTPLHHAIKFGKDNTAKWILQTYYNDPDKAAKLAQSSTGNTQTDVWEPGIEEIREWLQEQELPLRKVM